MLDFQSRYWIDWDTSNVIKCLEWQMFNKLHHLIMDNLPLNWNSLNWDVSNETNVYQASLSIMIRL